MKPVIGRGLRTIAGGLDHPEGVCWSPDEGVVYAGGEAGQLYRFALDGGAVDTVATVPGGFLLGMALDADRNVYACDPNSGFVMRISPDGDVQRHGERVGYPNYPVFDREGNLWVTDSGAWDEVTGGLVRIAPDGATERVDVPALRFANGCAISGDHLYLVESQMPGVVRMPLAGGELEPVVELPRTVPDGLAVDAEGGIWIGCYQPNRIYRLDAGGGAGHGRRRLDRGVRDVADQPRLRRRSARRAGAGVAVRLGREGDRPRGGRGAAGAAEGGGRWLMWPWWAVASWARRPPCTWPGRART